MSINIVTGRSIKDPESIYFELHDLSHQHNYRHESAIRFLIKGGIIAFILFILKITFNMNIPTVFYVISALFLSIIAIVGAFSIVNSLNYLIIKKGLQGFILFICIICFIAIIGGIF